MSLQFWVLALLMGPCAHQAHDFFCQEMQLSHLVVDETLGTWGCPLFFLH